ncbi:ABC transporter-related protein [Chloroherpeton thalassium ATCC 35110]|uniref:ABC transporter-related protein n=1 Tax=Chloroherpeton thalassium (strain ATCC 35110 / GB-78) TaxID=517418 RepID=B3QVR8_CHLT3|nr:ABC transporter ATP-binding protein [Chloroherpeton thalassium]ACF13125.1 ABC transporter-related protein [Chloroherpeton thalassium ATCC 35110]
MIELKQVYVNRGGETILSAISCRIGEGEKVVFRGTSGSGKSTLLKTLIGGQKISSGQMLFQGQPVEKKNIFSVRNSMSYIGQEPILGAETVREALLLPFSFKAHRHAKPSEEQIFLQLEKMHLRRDIIERKSAEISGGEKQRIAIARALLLRKRVFIADEITSALDPESKEAVMQCLFKPAHTVISVSHDPDWIARCSRILTIENGQLKESSAHGND